MKNQWSTEGQSIWPKPKFFTIRPSALGTKVLFQIMQKKLWEPRKILETFAVRIFIPFMQEKFDFYSL